MKTLSRLAPLLFLLSPLAFVALGCSSDKTTNPGGGGGGGGPTFDSGVSALNKSFQVAFTQDGTWSYRCTVHGSMTGSVTVNASGTDSALVHVAPGGAMSFSPQNVTVKNGSPVRWVWDQGGHSVTRP